MKTIVFASRKGGVGKTTLTGHVSLAASRAGREVVMIDADPQQSLTYWWGSIPTQDREEGQPVIVPLNAMDHVRSTPGNQLLVIDTPPSHDIEALIQVADLVVVPVRPSALDLRAVAATVELIERLNKRAVFVISSITDRSKLAAEAAITLSQYGTVAPVMVGTRQDYVIAMLEGRSVMDIDPKSKSSVEMMTLWDYLAKQLRK